jgi:hypothetical protein
VLPSLELNYGASDNLELHFLAGLAFDRQSPSGARFGSGDVELGVKYRFIEADEAGWRPDVAFAPALDLTAGDRRRARHRPCTCLPAVDPRPLLRAVECLRRGRLCRQAAESRVISAAG